RRRSRPLFSNGNGLCGRAVDVTNCCGNFASPYIRENVLRASPGEQGSRRIIQMSRLYACIISTELMRDKEVLQAIAHQFSYSIEMLADGILFDVSGLERLVGKPTQISQKILEELQKQNIPGSIAIAETVETAALLARQEHGSSHAVHEPETFQQLP